MASAWGGSDVLGVEEAGEVHEADQPQGPSRVGVGGDPDYPYINPLRIHVPPFIPTDRDEPCPYTGLGQCIVRSLVM